MLRALLLLDHLLKLFVLETVLGANPKTLFGLSGLGDLILTCNSLKSRNTSFGHLISSQPKVSITEHLKSLETTEGYFTVQAIHNNCTRKKY